MSNTSKRLAYADMMKGISILGVVFFHLLAPCGAKTVLDHLIDSLLIVFFFFSGFFYRPGKRTLWENIKNRFKATMIPFLRFSLAFWVIGTVYLLIVGQETIMEALWCLRNFFGGCIWNRVVQGWFGWEYHSLGSRYMYLADFWFLLALMLSSVLFFPVADAVLSSRVKTGAAVAVLFAITGVLRAFAVSLPYNLQLIPFWAAFMLLGAWAGKEKVFDRVAASGAKGWVLAVLALGVGVAVSMLHSPITNLYRGSFAEPEVVSMLLCICATVFITFGLTSLCMLAEQAGMRVNELSWLGSNSLSVYLYHMFFAWIISTVTGFSLKYPATADTGLVLLSLALTLACLGLCVLRVVIEKKLKKK